MPKKMGRPTKKTPDTLAVIKDWLEHGCTRKAAGAAAGISKDTFCSWMDKDLDFSDLVLRAEAVAERNWIERCESPYPGACIKLLARRFHDDWGDKVEIEHTGGVSVRFVNDWRGPTAVSPSWTADSTDGSQAV